MNERHYMPLFIGDYMRDTSHLSTAEHGAYLLLIMAYWANGGLPTDDEALQKISKFSPHLWKKHRGTISAFFDKNWRHKRIDQELKKCGYKHKIASEKAKKAAQVRWSAKDAPSNTTSNTPSMPLASSSMPQAMLGDAKPEPYRRSSFGSTSEQLTPSAELLAFEAQKRPIPKPTGGSLASAPDGGALASPPSALPNGEAKEATEKASKPVTAPPSQLTRAEYDAMLLRRGWQ